MTEEYTTYKPPNPAFPLSFWNLLSLFALHFHALYFVGFSPSKCKYPGGISIAPAYQIGHIWA
jgi:hypothetical protein